MDDIEQSLKQYYQDALQRSEFRILQCRDCGAFVFPVQAQCPQCEADAEDLRWVEPSGRGTVYSRPVLSEPGAAPGQGVIAQIELEEGPRIAARVMDVEADKLSVGMPVSAHVALLDGCHTLVFYNKEQGSNEW